MAAQDEGRSAATGERFPGYTEPREGGIEPRKAGPNRGRRQRAAESVIEPREGKSSEEGGLARKQEGPALRSLGEGGDLRRGGRVVTSSHGRPAAHYL